MRTRPAVWCLCALILVVATAVVLRSCRDDRACDLERLVEQSLELDAVEILQWGPHRLGERTSTLRVVYRDAGGKVRDELYLIRDGHVLLFKDNPHGDDWRER